MRRLAAAVLSAVLLSTIVMHGWAHPIPEKAETCSACAVGSARHAGSEAPRPVHVPVEARLVLIPAERTGDRSAQLSPLARAPPAA